jgi:hypothetical protein
VSASSVKMLYQFFFYWFISPSVRSLQI